MKESIIRHLKDIEALATAHGFGKKQVLLSGGETDSSVTQIAVTSLNAGEIVESHVHKTMDEHYLILEGNGTMTIGQVQHKISAGTYLLIASGEQHALKADTNIRMVTIGIAYDK